MKEIVKDKIIRINDVLADMDYKYHGFLGGSLGLLYYYYHAARVMEDARLLTKAETMLEAVFEDMNENHGGLAGPVFSSGGAGLGYVMNYLQQHGFIDFDVDAELGELDAYLFEACMTQIEKDITDYLHGALGIIFYFAERKQTPTINAYLNTLIEKLLPRGVQSDAGVWFRNAVWEDANKIDEINFSLSHGLCGILLVLMKAWPHLAGKPAVENVIRQGIQFMMKYELPVDFANKEYSFFPGRFKKMDTEITRNDRLAWCYGDLNQVLVCYRAGRLLGDARYTAIANRIGLKTIERKTMESTLNFDSHLCHGTAGLAQYYKALYAETFHFNYYNAYEHWVHVTTALVDHEIEGNCYAKNKGSLLEGWPGVGIVLTDYIAGQKTDWARAFLL
jgi:hypothetical protein